MSAFGSQRRYQLKWGACLSAAAQLVAEIYKFRCATLEYDSMPTTPSGGDEEPEDDGAQKPTVTKNRRDTFVERFQEINKFALDNVGSDSVKAHSYIDFED